jgi:hypothetical protein
MNRLAAVSALTPTAAWAVGGTFVGAPNAGSPIGPSGATVSLIEQWDGTRWQIVPNPGGDFLNGVTAVSATDVWAVGGVSSYPIQPHPLIEHWNGTQWSSVPGPSPSPAQGQLSSVVAAAPNDVWAVGDYYNSALEAQAPLIEHWNGTSWQLVATPALPSGVNPTLSAVARIPGTNQLWAVGYSVAVPALVVERWDGTSWQVVPSPPLPSGAHDPQFHSVVALSAMDAWAVGYYTASDSNYAPLIAHWDGKSWQTVTTPVTFGWLLGVVAAGPDDVRAAGVAVSVGHEGHAMTERWDGASWQLMMTPEPSGAAHSYLRGITADTAGTFWTVGGSDTAAGVAQTLTEHCP